MYNLGDPAALATSDGSASFESPIIVALDCDREETLRLAHQIQGLVSWVKVGMTLCYLVGPSIIEELRSLGFNVFIDLKLHDIPHQVRGAATSLTRTGAEMLTVHASGGVEMMRQAVEGAHATADAAGTKCPTILAVTVLTSMDDETLRSIGVEGTAEQQVDRLAHLAKEAGCDGVVCSPLEAARMRTILGPDAAIVTPGVRPLWSATGDQSRITTPARAIEAGASHLVIGRPITEADDPCEAIKRIHEELKIG